VVLDVFGSRSHLTLAGARHPHSQSGALWSLTMRPGPNVCAKERPEVPFSVRSFRVLLDRSPQISLAGSLGLVNRKSFAIDGNGVCVFGGITLCDRTHVDI
jgi:hypothetical protein